MYCLKQEGISIILDGTEEYFTLCGECQTKIDIDIDEFIRVAAEHGIYDTIYYCAKCTVKRKVNETHPHLKLVKSSK